MYTREIQAPRASPIENGNPLIGTWNRAFEKVNLLEIQNPYPFPLPRWARNLRIKEWQCFNIQNDDLVFEAVIYNLKLCRIVQVLVYEKQSDKKHFFREINPGANWALPCSLADSSIEGRSSNINFRIHNWLEADIIRLDINIDAVRHRPPLTVHIEYNVRDICPVAVSLGLAERRTMYAYKTLASACGDIVLGERRINLMHDTCSGFFCDYKGFFPCRMQTAVCSATGFLRENRRFGFHITENKTREPNKNNENALWVDGKLTPLPPVLITMPNGIENMWVIQDVEGMIDLTFTPKDQNINDDFNMPMGYYNGMLVNAFLNEEKIQIKNLLGIGKKNIL